MNDFPEPDMVTRSERIEETAMTLHTISLQISELQRIKEGLESKLNKLIEHPEDGQKTYTYGKWKVTLKTGFNYSLDVDEYETVGHFLPDGFNPVTKKTKYEINKNTIKACEKFGSPEENELLNKLIKTKPTKLSVKILPGC